MNASTIHPTNWAELEKMVPGLRPDVATLRDLVSTQKLPPVIEVSALSGEAASTARILAAAMNCQTPVGGDPCTDCSGCRDALGVSGLAVIWIDGAHATAATLGRLRPHLMAQPSIRWQVVAVTGIRLIKGKATKAALEQMLKKPPEATTFVLIRTGEEG